MLTYTIQYNLIHYNNANLTNKTEMQESKQTDSLVLTSRDTTHMTSRDITHINPFKQPKSVLAGNRRLSASTNQGSTTSDDIQSQVSCMQLFRFL